VPLHTLRAKVDYGTAEAKTPQGRIGVKVWVYHGDEVPYREQELQRAKARATARARGPRPDRAERPERPERAQRAAAPAPEAAAHRLRRPRRRPRGGRVLMLAPKRSSTASSTAGICGQGEGSHRDPVRRLRDRRDGAGLDHEPADRGQPCRDDAPHQAWRKVWITIFPDKPVTKKPPRPGWARARATPRAGSAVVRPGRVMFELAGVPEALAREAMLRASTSCDQDEVHQPGG